MTAHTRGKWQAIIRELQQRPGEMKLVGEDVGPYVVQRLRALGAIVETVISQPREGLRQYDLYTVYARWPEPTSERAYAQIEVERVTPLLREAEAELRAAEEIVTQKAKQLKAARRNVTLISRRVYQLLAELDAAQLRINKAEREHS